MASVHEYGGYGSFEIYLDGALDAGSETTDAGYDNSFGSDAHCGYDGGEGVGFEDGDSGFP